MKNNLLDFFTKIDIWFSTYKNSKKFFYIKKYINLIYISSILIALSFYFYRYFGSSKFYLILSNENFIIMALSSVVLYVIASMLGILSFSLLVKSFTNNIPDNYFLKFIKVNIYKYLPSNTLHYVGRAFLLRKSLSLKKILLLHLFEASLLILALFFILIFTSSFYFIGVFVVIAFLFFKTKYRNIIFFATFYYLMAFLLLSVIFYINAVYLINVNLLFLDTFKFYSTSFLLALFAPGLPAGMGTRELITFLLFDGIISKQNLTILVIIIRFYSFISDIFLYCISVFLLQKIDNQNFNNKNIEE